MVNEQWILSIEFSYKTSIHLETRRFNGGNVKNASLTSIIFSKTSHRCDVFEKMIDVNRR
jgi:hypothetical protein